MRTNRFAGGWSVRGAVHLEGRGTVSFKKDCGPEGPSPTCLLHFGGFGYLKLAAAFRIMMSLGKGEHATASLKYTQTPQKPVDMSGERPSRPQPILKRTVYLFKEPTPLSTHWQGSGDLSPTLRMVHRHIIHLARKAVMEGGLQ